MHFEHEFALYGFARFVGKSLAVRNSDGIWWTEILARLVAYAQCRTMVKSTNIACP